MMISAILFNAGGYELFFQYLIYRSDNRIFNKINHSDYRTSDFIEVKVPVNLPSQAAQEDWDSYHELSGQIEFRNTKYDYAEIKFTRDTLYLHVIPNTERNKLVKADDMYGKRMNDIPGDNSKKPVDSWSKTSARKTEPLVFYYVQSPLSDIKKSYNNFIVPVANDPLLEVGGQPPEA